MQTTKQIIEKLVNEYINDPCYTSDIINRYWIDKITTELNLQNLSDLELSNMWDFVWMTIECLYSYHYINKNIDIAYTYLDVKSAFVEVINLEARRRKALNITINQNNESNILKRKLKQYEKALNKACCRLEDDEWYEDNNNTPITAHEWKSRLLKG